MTPHTLRHALATMGLSSAQAAQLLGVDHGTVNRWLAGTRAVPEPVRRLLLACHTFPELRLWIAMHVPTTQPRED
jgi:transcriptional regulator with XRE-family HTH domain